MEPAKVGSVRSSKWFESISPRLFVEWLKSPKGRPLREAIEKDVMADVEAWLFTSEEGRRLQELVIERAGTEQRVVIDCEPLADGRWVLRCYGPPAVKVAIVQRPKVPPTERMERLAEQVVELDLPKTYQRVLPHLRLRKQALLEAIDVLDYCGRYQEVQFRRAVYDTFNELTKRTK